MRPPVLRTGRKMPGKAPENPAGKEKRASGRAVCQKLFWLYMYACPMFREPLAVTENPGRHFVLCRSSCRSQQIFPVVQQRLSRIRLPFSFECSHHKQYFPNIVHKIFLRCGSVLPLPCPDESGAASHGAGFSLSRIFGSFAVKSRLLRNTAGASRRRDTADG